MSYGIRLSKEWSEWVETPGAGTRDAEIFPFIKKWLKNIKPKVLADVGCGQGICSTLVSSNTEYIGIDPSVSLIERAKQLYSSPNRQFIKGDAYRLPLEDASVDAVISIWVWSHLGNIKLAASEMCRVLNPKGHYLIITANPETYEERKTFYKHYSIKGNLLTGTFDLGNGKALTDTTLYLHTKEEIENAIKQAGLKINSITRMGQAETSDKGLYLVIEGSK